MTNRYLKKTLIVTFIALILWPSTAFAGPTSTNYELEQFGFGSGGTNDSTSTNFGLFGASGEVDLGNLSSTNFKLKAGLTETLSSNVVPAPTLGDGSGTYYNKLSISFADAGNPTDAQFLIAVSTDGFSADTKYVQANHTLGTSQTWQTYFDWSSGSFNIIGLSPGTTYSVKISTRHGDFTQSPFSETSQEDTIDPSLSFDIDVAPTDSETSSPFSVNIGDLIATTVVTAPNKVWVDLSTNGTSGGMVYIYGSNGGLLSTSVAKTINSQTANLSITSEGYGAQSSSVNQSSGGPVQAVSPYDGASDNVGIIDSTKRIIFDSSNLPVVSGRASFDIKAKASAITEAASDYTDTLTVIATAGF